MPPSRPARRWCARGSTPSTQRDSAATAWRPRRCRALRLWGGRARAGHEIRRLRYHRQAVVLEADRAPEADAALVADQHFQADARALAPRIFAQPSERRAADAALAI